MKTAEKTRAVWGACPNYDLNEREKFDNHTECRATGTDCFIADVNSGRSFDKVVLCQILNFAFSRSDSGHQSTALSGTPCCSGGELDPRHLFMTA